MRKRLTSAFALLFALVPISASADDALDRLISAYPQTLSGHDGNVVIFRDGIRLDAGAADPDKSFAALVSHATILDQLQLTYPKGAPISPPAFNFDPGRFRNAAFFDHMYGDCRKGEVEKNLVSVVWLPKHAPEYLRFTRINGAADRLREVSAEIDALSPSLMRAAYPSAGTYSCRGVADMGQPSMHAYGAAVDLNLKLSNYWIWDVGKNAKTIPYRNRMPIEIVNIFERHGFIWGGRWYHYDTMHFEYRPELLTGTEK
jgi:hypothetical protein